jgi:hypothetical protein
MALLGLAGCDQGAAKIVMPDVSPAAGVVTYNGEPVDGAHVLFVSSASKTNGWACGNLTDENGKFEISTTVSSTSVKGVPPGEYVVVVTKKREATAEEEKEAQEQYNAKAATATDPSKLQDEFKAQLQKSLIPVKYNDPSTTDLKATIGADGNTDIELKLTD